jgi:hypothetical protein
VRAWSASAEEALRARNLVKDWAGEGFITPSQYRRMEQETVCDLRRTNIFLRLVLFLFTLIVAGAAAALFFVVFLSQRGTQTKGIFLLIFAAISYAAAESAVSLARLYRYGIEEALAVCSVGFLCVGMELALFSGRPYSPKPDAMEFLVPAAGAVASLWIWHRFGFAYAFFAAMIFVVWMPGYWTASHSAQHLIVAAFYAAGLITVPRSAPATVSRTSTKGIRSSKRSSGSAFTRQSISSFRLRTCSGVGGVAPGPPLNSQGRSTGPPGC